MPNGPFSWSRSQIFNNTTVMVQFNVSSQENDYRGLLVSYLNVTSLSQVEMQTQGIQLVIPYNTQINVSIIACLCGQHRILTIFQLTCFIVSDVKTV